MASDLIAQHSLHSVLREVTVEHLFVGELLRNLWTRGIVDAEVLHSEFDAGGYDLVLSHREVIRHIQLKTKRAGGSTASVSVSLNLAAKPSGCVIWIVVSDDLQFSSYLWFGGDVGQPLPEIAELRVTKHTKGNKDGEKGDRANHRKVGIGRFERLTTLDQVIVKLLGPAFDR